MDVFCVGMYRACSTWQYEVAAHLIERHRGGVRLGYVTGDAYQAASPENAWRILKSHEAHPRFRDRLCRGQARAIYAFRDVRDVVYSLAHKQGVDFETLMRWGLVHQILDNDRFWRSCPGLLVQRYEDLVTQPVQGVREVAAFLDVPLEADEAQQIALAYSLESNRKRTAQIARTLEARGVDLSDPRNALRSDHQTLLHWNHVRQGAVGGWKGEATPAQRRSMARLFGPWLARYGYAPDERLGQLPGGGPGERFRATRLRAEGWVHARLRCLSLRHPLTAAATKRWLVRILPVKTRWSPAPETPTHRHQAAA